MKTKILLLLLLVGIVITVYDYQNEETACAKEICREEFYYKRYTVYCAFCPGGYEWVDELVSAGIRCSGSDDDERPSGGGGGGSATDDSTDIVGGIPPVTNPEPTTPVIPPPPPKPDYVPPSVPSITIPSTGGFPSWYPDPNLSVDNLPKDVESTVPSDPLVNLTDGKEIEIRHTNIPKNGIVNLNGESFSPELVLRNKNYTWLLPFSNKIDSVTKEELDKLWGQFTASGNEVDLFIYEVKNPSSLPTDPKNFFTKPKTDFMYHTTIKNTFPDLTGFKIDKSGYYVVGARITSNGKQHYEILPVKITIQNSYGYLPIKNNLSTQYNQNMLTTGWKQSTHSIGDLTFENYKSIKAPSSYNHTHKISALGSSKGTFGVKLFNEDSTINNLNVNVPNGSIVTEILEFQEGFLVATNNNGLFYLNLNEKKIFKLSNINSDKITDIYVDKNQVYVATNSELISGEIVSEIDPINNLTTKVEFIKSKNITNSDIFNISSEISNVELVLNKIILTPKSGNASVAIIDKF